MKRDGVLESWSIGVLGKRTRSHLFLLHALLHHSITPPPHFS